MAVDERNYYGQLGIYYTLGKLVHIHFLTKQFQLHGSRLMVRCGVLNCEIKLLGLAMSTAINYLSV